MLFWSRKKNTQVRALTSPHVIVALTLLQRLAIELQAISSHPILAPQPRTRDRSMSAPPASRAMNIQEALRSSTDVSPVASPLSPKRAIYSPESIVPIYLSPVEPQPSSPAQEKHYPTREWDGSGDFPDTHGLVAELNFDVLGDAPSDV